MIKRCAWLLRETQHLMLESKTEKKTTERQEDVVGKRAQLSRIKSFKTLLHEDDELMSLRMITPREFGMADTFRVEFAVALNAVRQFRNYWIDVESGWWMPRWCLCCYGNMSFVNDSSERELNRVASIVFQPRLLIISNRKQSCYFSFFSFFVEEMMDSSNCSFFFTRRWMFLFIYYLLIFFLRNNLESVWSQRFEFRSFNFAERNLKQFFIFLCFHSQGLIWTFPIDYWSISIDIFECDHVWIFKINGSLWTTELLIVQYLKLLNIYRGFESASEYKNLTLHNLFGNWNRFF